MSCCVKLLSPEVQEVQGGTVGLKSSMGKFVLYICPIPKSLYLEGERPANITVYIYIL